MIDNKLASSAQFVKPLTLGQKARSAGLNVPSKGQRERMATMGIALPSTRNVIQGLVISSVSSAGSATTNTVAPPIDTLLTSQTTANTQGQSTISGDQHSEDGGLGIGVSTVGKSNALNTPLSDEKIINTLGNGYGANPLGLMIGKPVRISKETTPKSKKKKSTNWLKAFELGMTAAGNARDNTDVSSLDGIADTITKIAQNAVSGKSKNSKVSKGKVGSNLTNTFSPGSGKQNLLNAASNPPEVNGINDYLPYLIIGGASLLLIYAVI